MPCESIDHRGDQIRHKHLHLLAYQVKMKHTLNRDRVPKVIRKYARATSRASCPCPFASSGCRSATDSVSWLRAAANRRTRRMAGAFSLA